MKRLSLFGFVGLLAGVLAGCPIYNGNGGGTEPYSGGTGGSQCFECGIGGSSPAGCQSPADCPANETCGTDYECHPGDCTYTMCLPGYSCESGANQEATCVPSGAGGGGGQGGGSTTTSTGSSQGGGGQGGSGTTTTGSGGHGGGSTSSTTGGGQGGAGGQPAATPCTGADGAQGTCATGSICLDLHCYISCDPSNNQCPSGEGLPLCEPVPNGASTYHICGSATQGSQCGALAPDGGAPCAPPTLCIDGTCQ